MKHMKRIILSLFVVSLLVACEQEAAPLLGTLSVAVDASNPEVLSCSVEVIEGDVADCGFYYGTSKNSVSNGKSDKVAGTYVGTTIQGEITKLIANTTYFIRAYAMNEKGQTFTEVVQVKTAASKPGADDNLHPGTLK